MVQANSNYSFNPWMQDMPVQVQRPNASYEDALTGQALMAAMSEPAEEIRQIRPPIPITPFPPKYGYRTTALGIDDIVDLSDIYERRDFSGKKSGMGSTSYPSLNQF